TRQHGHSSYLSTGSDLHQDRPRIHDADPKPFERSLRDAARFGGGNDQVCLTQSVVHGTRNDGALQSAATKRGTGRGSGYGQEAILAEPEGRRRRLSVNVGNVAHDLWMKEQ